MKEYIIITQHTFYKIDEDGCFLQYNEHKWKHPHNSWKCTGCAKVLPFNNLRFYKLDEFLGMIKEGQIITFKNGKPKYTLTDNDHGTNRVHGNIAVHGIISAFCG